MNDKKQSFKELVKDCLHEVKEERIKKQQLREALKKYVRGVLKEVISGPDAPEQDKAEQEKINKGFTKDGNQSSEESQDAQVQELTKIVHGINAEFTVYRETEGVTGAYTSGKRNFIIVDAGDLFSVRIKERWENNFDIEAFTHGADRIIALGLSWAQVKAFVKANFTEKSKSYVQKGMDKVVKNREDQVDKRDTDLPDTSIKNRGEKNNGEDAKLKTTKKDDMDYKKDDVEKDEDQPSAPMKAVAKTGKSPETKNQAKDQKETDKVKPPKVEKSPKDLKSDDKKTSKFNSKE